MIEQQETSKLRLKGEKDEKAIKKLKERVAQLEEENAVQHQQIETLQKNVRDLTEQTDDLQTRTRLEGIIEQLEMRILSLEVQNEATRNMSDSLT